MASRQLNKTYEPQAVEARWGQYWIDRGYFGATADSAGQPYTIVIPPPNVTGSLHIGHALNNTLQDILIRWRRMQGRNTLWLPGTDHAGIATQNVVERQLLEEGTQREQLGARRVHRTGLVMETAIRRYDTRTTETTWGLLRLVSPALYHG